MHKLAVVIALVAACGDDDSGGGDIPLAGFEAARINMRCNTFVSCGLIDDAAVCRSLHILDYPTNPSVIAAVEAGKVIYHGDKARECVNSVSTSCTGPATGLFNSDACDQMFEGTVGAGGQCALAEECVSHVCNWPQCPDACCQGTCVGDAPPPPRPRVGESCTLALDCIDSFCDGATMTCMAYRAPGQSCRSGGECINGTCPNQICVANPGPGEACNPQTAPCGSIGLTCSATTMTCVAYGLSGDPCTGAADCSPFYSCSTAGSCELLPRLGEACSTQGAYGGCIDHSYCEPATLMCTAPKPDGSACGLDQECTSRHCDDLGLMACATPPVCI